ncbi:MAG: dTMP kinase [Methyloligella sp. ZOD6]
MRFDNGRLITLEGGEGSGKSTQAEILATRLARAGRRVVATREPGGSPGAEAIREALLSGKVSKYGPFAEALLFAVARKDHIDSQIGAAVSDGKWVVCDRFIDSTRAYQGAMAGLSRQVIASLERLTVGDLIPDLTLILDINPEEGMARANARRGADEEADRFEQEQLFLHDRVRQGFLDIAEEEPERCVVIDASQDEEIVAEDIWEAVTERLGA